jgi:uncharacterized protein (DUF1697 family)
VSARKKAAAKKAAAKKQAKKATRKATAATRASRTKVAVAPREPGSRAAGTRHAAFLRAINVGGRTVTMDRLRAAFAGLPVGDVETFIASGNVLFTSDARDAAGAAALERAIERRLAEALGYAVETFVRDAAEIAALARFEPFAGVAEGHKLHVGFLREAPAAAAAARLAALGTDYDTLVVHGRELWWWTKGNMSDSRIPNGAFEKVLGMPTTLRNVNTVRRIAAKFGGGVGPG